MATERTTGAGPQHRTWSCPVRGETSLRVFRTGAGHQHRFTALPTRGCWTSAHPRLWPGDVLAPVAVCQHPRAPVAVCQHPRVAVPFPARTMLDISTGADSCSGAECWTSAPAARSAGHQHTRALSIWTPLLGIFPRSQLVLLVELVSSSTRPARRWDLEEHLLAEL